MTDTCTCAPNDCHGGHTINIGPVTVGAPEPIDAAKLRALAADANRATLQPGYPFGGEGPSQWSCNLDAMLGGPTGAFCAAVSPNLIVRLLNDLDSVRGLVAQLADRVEVLEAEAQADERAIEEARDERDAARDRAAEAETEQQELIGFAVASTAGQDDYLGLASDLLHRQADTAHGELIMARAESPSTPWRVVELREVTE